MLFSTVSAKSLVFLLLSGSVVFTSPVPNDNNVEAKQDNNVSVLLDVNVLTGIPELLEDSEKRFFDEEDDLQRRQVANPPTADHREALRLHNAARTRKGLKPLVWDKQLETDAKAYAKQIAAQDKMVHSSSASRPNQGENLAYTWSTAKILDAVTRGTKGWLAEEKDYNGEKIGDGNFAAYGHWTQAMWRSSTKVGIAAASNGKGAYYIVARYSPPGNYIGQKPY